MFLLLLFACLVMVVCLRVFVCFFFCVRVCFCFCVHVYVLFARVKVKQVNKSTNSLIKILIDLLTWNGTLYFFFLFLIKTFNIHSYSSYQQPFHVSRRHIHAQAAKRRETMTYRQLASIFSIWQREEDGNTCQMPETRGNINGFAPMIIIPSLFPQHHHGSHLSSVSAYQRVGIDSTRYGYG